MRVVTVWLLVGWLLLWYSLFALLQSMGKTSKTPLWRLMPLVGSMRLREVAAFLLRVFTAAAFAEAWYVYVVLVRRTPACC